MRTTTTLLLGAALAAAAAVLPAELVAQVESCGLSSGGGGREVVATPHVRGYIVWCSTTAPNVKLLVLWRGQEGWTRSPGGRVRGGSGSGDERQSMYREDSIASYTMERNVVTRTVVINGRDTLPFSPDSLLIVMVDRVDNIGGVPIVTSFSVAPQPLPALQDRATSAAARSAMAARAGRGESVEWPLVTFLNSMPRTREFINRSSARPIGDQVQAAVGERVVIPVPTRNVMPTGTSSGGGDRTITPRTRVRYEFEPGLPPVAALMFVYRDAPSERSGQMAGMHFHNDFRLRGAVPRDAEVRRIVVGLDTVLLHRDSTTIVMVDYGDRANGRPRMASVRIAPVPVAVFREDRTDAALAVARRAGPPASGDNAYTRLLQSIPAVLAFIR